MKVLSVLALAFFLGSTISAKADNLVYDSFAGTYWTGHLSTPELAAQDAALHQAGTAGGMCGVNFLSGNRAFMFWLMRNNGSPPDCGIQARATCQSPTGEFYTPTVMGPPPTEGGKGWFPAQNYLQCKCPAAQQWDSSSNKCVAGPKNFGTNNCSALQGNPINVGWGNKVQREIDYLGPNGVALTRTYNSKLALIRIPINSTILPQRWGANWRSTYDRQLILNNSFYSSIALSRPDGAQFGFTGSYGNWTSDADVSFKLSLPSGGIGAYQVRDLITDDIEIYDNTGKLLSITSRSGIAQTMTYSDGTAGANGGYVLDASGNATSTILPAGFLIRVTDAFGLTLSFGYDGNHVVKMVDPSGGIYLYSYDANDNLVSMTYPTTSGYASRQYLYNEATYSAIDPHHYAHALTGIVDESSIRFAIFQYDAEGRAIVSTHAGSAEKTSVTYSTDSSNKVTSAVVTDPLSTARTYQFQTILGVPKAANASLPAEGGCGTANATSFDANGNTASTMDFNGNVTNRSYNLARNLDIPL